MQLPKLQLKRITAFIMLIAFSTLIWIAGPLLHIHGHTPLAPFEQRIYAIIALWLLWVLKTLSFPYKNTKAKEKLSLLQEQFHGATSFLKKTHLYDLPWYLFIGPVGAGKTSLLNHAETHFILKKQFKQEDPTQLPSSEYCDWWVTRHLSIIDVPGKYFRLNDAFHRVLWKTLLHLIKKYRTEQGIRGILIAIPLPELMQDIETPAYQEWLLTLFQRIAELKKVFSAYISFHIIITQCDALPGFKEFFGESTHEDITQPWGVTLIPPPGKEKKIVDTFIARFDLLIKKLNNQLIWRLHQERNLETRPLIKDFPLQMERLKEYLGLLIKKWTVAHPDCIPQDIYLTSAIQASSKLEASSEKKSLQILQTPAYPSRPYFIKQLIAKTLHSHDAISKPVHIYSIKTIAVYAAAILAISLSIAALEKDFLGGLQQTRLLQSDLQQYQTAIQQSGDPGFRLTQAVKLLNTLQKSAEISANKNLFYRFFYFYSEKSQETANILFMQALPNIFLPEIKNYMEYYLQTHDGKNTEYHYAVLKSYLMLENSEHFSAPFVCNTLKQILPKNLKTNDVHDFMEYTTLALTHAWRPMTINPTIVENTREIFRHLSNFELAYTILKNMEENNLDTEINLGINIGDPPLFLSSNVVSLIPRMFTASTFNTVISQEIDKAAIEATQGNWVINNVTSDNKTTIIPFLAKQLYIAYTSNYVDVWESLLANIKITAPKNLDQVDALLVQFTSHGSPLLQLLQTVHDNTYFAPILSISPKLNGLNTLLINGYNQPDNLLYQVFSGLNALHTYLQPLLTAENPEKIAFDMTSSRMKNAGTPDQITQLRLIAEKSPEPLKIWLLEIADATWRYLLQSASQYIDTAWQTDVFPLYQQYIANYYPFNPDSKQPVDKNQFTTFFGHIGALQNFYAGLLKDFVDEKNGGWKTMDNQTLSLSATLIKQVQMGQTLYKNHTPAIAKKFHLEEKIYAEDTKS